MAAESRPEKIPMSKQRSSSTGTNHHIPMFNGVEMALVSPLIKSTNFDYDLVTECENRGYLPLKLMDGLHTVKFLSRTVLAAQKAQRTYGVPASVLISIAMDKSAFDADNLLENSQLAVEWPGCGCCYSPEILKWFMKMAERLTESPKCRNAMKLLPDISAYVKRLFSLKLGSNLDAEDVLANVANYGLEDCDLAALRQPGEHRKSEFTPIRDKHGAVTLVNPLVQGLLDLEREDASRRPKSEA
jgi:hypothetical protein